MVIRVNRSFGLLGLLELLGLLGLLRLFLARTQYLLELLGLRVIRVSRVILRGIRVIKLIELSGLSQQLGLILVNLLIGRTVFRVTRGFTALERVDEKGRKAQAACTSQLRH